VKELASQRDEIYLFCRSGNRSEKARKILQDQGYKQVFNIGGLEEAKDFIRRKRNDL
jgi:phage shock protein E